MKSHIRAYMRWRAEGRIASAPRDRNQATQNQADSIILCQGLAKLPGQCLHDLPPDSEWAAIDDHGIESDNQIGQSNHNGTGNDKDDGKSKNTSPTIEAHGMVVVRRVYVCFAGKQVVLVNP